MGFSSRTRDSHLEKAVSPRTSVLLEAVVWGGVGQGVQEVGPGVGFGQGGRA